MDGDEVWGYVLAVAWLGMFIYLPLSEIRKNGLKGWVDELRKQPISVVGTAMLFIGCTGFLLSLLTGGWWPIRTAIGVPAGFFLLWIGHRVKR